MEETHEERIERIAQEDRERLGYAIRQFLEAEGTSKFPFLEEGHGIHQRVETLERKVDGLVLAFPGGDVEGHRRYHEMLIEGLEEKRKLRRAIQEKTISGLLWSVIVFMGVALWTYVKTHIRGGP